LFVLFGGHENGQVDISRHSAYRRCPTVRRPHVTYLFTYSDVTVFVTLATSNIGLHWQCIVRHCLGLDISLNMYTRNSGQHVASNAFHLLVNYDISLSARLTLTTRINLMLMLQTLA